MLPAKSHFPADVSADDLDGKTSRDNTPTISKRGVYRWLKRVCYPYLDRYCTLVSQITEASLLYPSEFHQFRLIEYVMPWLFKHIGIQYPTTYVPHVDVMSSQCDHDTRMKKYAEFYRDRFGGDEPYLCHGDDECKNPHLTPNMLILDLFMLQRHCWQLRQREYSHHKDGRSLIPLDPLYGWNPVENVRLHLLPQGPSIEHIVRALYPSSDSLCVPSLTCLNTVLMLCSHAMHTSEYVNVKHAAFWHVFQHARDTWQVNHIDLLFDDYDVLYDMFPCFYFECLPDDRPQGADGE